MKRVLALILVAAVAGCGGSNESSSGATAGGPTTTAGSGGGATTTPATVGSSGAITTVTRPPASAAFPADPCALLSAEDVAAVLPDAGPGTAESSVAGLATCSWRGADQPSHPGGSLHLTIADTTVVPIRGLDINPYAEQVEDLPDLGDEAMVETKCCDDPTLQFIAGNFFVEVELSSFEGDYASRKALVITAAHAIAARL